MQKLETVGDLRKFIETQGGEFRLGKISISSESGEDVDIKYNNETMEWIPLSMEDERELSEVSIYSHMGEWGKIKKEEPKPEPEVETQPEPKSNKEEQEKAMEMIKRQGAADIMEKILMGRKVTLE